MKWTETSVSSASSYLVSPWSNDNVWQTSSNVSGDTGWIRWICQQEETAEQRVHRQQAAEVTRQRHRDMLAVRAAAADRAERLLSACLTTEQRATLEREGWFDVRGGGRAGRVFRIRRGRVRNVIDIHTRQTYCCHPAADVPDADTMLAQKLMLETQEDEFLRLANVS